jgi:hypothetical protein
VSANPNAKSVKIAAPDQPKYFVNRVSRYLGRSSNAADAFEYSYIISAI